MDSFPVVDPIPLPAPVWLFKVLHVVTLALHFVALEMLLGGLLIAVVLSAIRGGPASQTAAAAIARRLTVVMTYVINLGVPPLLFAQVLYGRAIYTSSVLMGLWWILVIPLLTVCYWLLYRFSARLEKGRPAWLTGAAAWLLAGAIAKIYSSNMTLMLRPEAWGGMYAGSSFGTMLPQGDPTLIARWLCILAGGIMVAGLWMLYLSARSTFAVEEGQFLWIWGGRATVAGGVVTLAAALQVVAAQPAGVQSQLAGSTLYSGAAWFWLVAVALSIAAGLYAGFTKAVKSALALGTPLLALLATAGMTLYRDGIRDLTLLGKGYDVWARTVVTNWSVVILFLVLFVAGLVTVGWLLTVVAKAKKLKESVA